MIASTNILKRWTVLDRFTGKIHDITDQEFAEGLLTNVIELRGKFVTDQFNKKIWIDAVTKK